MSNAENHHAERTLEDDQDHMADFAERAKDLDFMLSMTAEARTSFWQETLAYFELDHHAAKFAAAAACGPLNDSVRGLMPECDFAHHHAAYYGKTAIESQLQQQQNDFAMAVLEPSVELMTTKAEQAYAKAAANTSYLISRIKDKDADDARWSVAKFGVSEWLSHVHDISNPMETWLAKPENQSTLAFIESFPQDEPDLFNKLYYPEALDTSLTEAWKYHELLEHDARLIVSLYSKAIAKHHFERNALAKDIDAEDSNRLRAQLTTCLTRSFLEQYHYTIVSMEKNNDDDDPYVHPNDLPMQFTQPEHDQIAGMIKHHFDSCLTSIETSIHASLDHSNTETLISAITDLQSMQQNQEMFNQTFDPTFPTLNTSDERAQLEELYGSYRNKLIAAMLEEASQHVTDAMPLHEVMHRIDIRPISALDTMVQYEWLNANHPMFMADTEP